MATHKLDPEISAHLEWIGFVRQTGLVVSAPALVRAGAILDRRDTEGQRLLRACIESRAFDPKEEPAPYLPDFRVFAETVLGWSFSAKAYAGTAESPIPPELEVLVSGYDETLRPDLAVRELEPKDGASPWQLVGRILEPGQDFDSVVSGHAQLEASAHSRMERLLRQTGVPAGFLFNGLALRLVSAPRGESSGWLDFRVGDMIQTAGRPISTALRLLLGQARLLSLPPTQRFAALLEDSRKFQNEVSERLAEQVLHALYELLRGFQAAHDASKGELLRQSLTEHPDEVYRALLTVILRLVFLLYAEERDMLPEDETFLRYYSLAGLYERLREDAALFPDTMDQRYGAWAQLLVLFRMIHDGAESGSMRLPKRHGALFDPDRFKFLEGRPSGAARRVDARVEPPLVPDGTIYRALEKLLVLDGERISYRALDVEQIGSVYETMMGFRLETTTGRSVAIRADKKQGAPTAIDLELLLAEPGGNRDKWVQERADRKLTDTVSKATAEAKSLEDLHAALLPVLDLAATPDIVPKGTMVLRPSEERRRSGSHYTPRALTEPIVRTTLEPILARLRRADGKAPLAAQILDLKVCDPAMGSGAFLVEACRQLGVALVEAWHAHGKVPAIPPDEDELIFARRLIAPRCLYGVDKNPVAVDLAKVSLWLVTLAKDHALTFLDHALRHGDSLVGLSLEQIQGLNWHPQTVIEGVRAKEHIAKAADLRKQVREADDSMSDRELRELWHKARVELGSVRLFGDLVLAAFFEGEKPHEREAKRREYATAVLGSETERYRQKIEYWRDAARPLVPFHWEIEYPEVFERAAAGFDAVVGNPPFLAGGKISTSFGSQYLDWLKEVHPDADGGSDLVSYFFRLGFRIIKRGGCCGLIATNTISQGETRRASLCYLCANGGAIYSATKRLPWPGRAAVVASVVHFRKNATAEKVEARLNHVPVSRISSFLLASYEDDDPKELRANRGLAFGGAKIYGQGFVLTPAERDKLCASDPANAERIKPYLGGQEINTYPDPGADRYVIHFGAMSLEQAARWSDLLRIVEERVKPERDRRVGNAIALRQKKYWWRFRSDTPLLKASISTLSRCIVASQVSTHHAMVFQACDQVFSHAVNVFALEDWSSFAVIQCRLHEVWARFLGSSMKDDLRYTPSSCFDTFPFPVAWRDLCKVSAAGKTYYDFRSALMIRRNEGLTKTYNRFHDPNQRDVEIRKLRDLHDAMDSAVLDAYGWSEIKIRCEFLLDYQINQDEWGDKKKPFRYRWPDEIRDEILARLLDLNARCSKEEECAGEVPTKKRGKKGPTKPSTEAGESGELF